MSEVSSDNREGGKKCGVPTCRREMMTYGDYTRSYFVILLVILPGVKPGFILPEARR